MKGFITFDVIFATLAVLFMLYIYLMINNIILQSNDIEYKDSKKMAELVLLSDSLVKLDLAAQDGPLIYSNIISETKWKQFSLQGYVRTFNTSYISVAIQTSKNATISELGSSSYKYCIRRIVLATNDSAQQEISALDVCIGE